VADGAGGDLHDGSAGLAKAEGVVFRGEVSHDDAGFHFLPERLDGFAEKGGFSRTGRGHHVYRKQATPDEEAAVSLSQALVFREDGLAYFDGSAGMIRVVVFPLMLVVAPEVVIMVVGITVHVRMRVVVGVMMRMAVPNAARMLVLMIMGVIMVMAAADFRRAFAGQSASAFCAHLLNLH
jgi:hypothetical protein